MDGVFVTAVGAILDTVALVRVGNTSATFALELVFAAALISAGVGFVGFVPAIVLTVARERHTDAMIVGALVFVRLAGERSAALIRMLVTSSLVTAV